MANTFTAPFVQVYKTEAVTLTSAALSNAVNVNSLNMGAIVTAGTQGALVTKLTAIPKGTITASSLLLWLVKAKAPSTPQLIDSELMPAYAISVTAAIPETVFSNISVDTPLRLEAGDILYVGSQVAQAAGIVFKAEWGNL